MATTSVELPPDLQVGKFLKARQQEIDRFTEDLSVPHWSGKLASQKVPRHMRRRAVSHNPKRLPKRLREAHRRDRQKGGQDGKDVVPKRPSRKHRRRPKYLLEEYNRRQMKSGQWLETHIWHAKRFHIDNKWRWKIPLHPNDKNWRDCYRATTKKALLVDISYHQVVEIGGPDQESLIERLDRLTKHHQRFDQQLEGGKEATAVLYYPQDHQGHPTVGEVTFIWLPGSSSSKVSNDSENPNAVPLLWVWLHPSMCDEAVRLLQAVLDMPVSSTETSTHSTEDNGRQEPVETDSTDHASQKRKLESSTESSNAMKKQKNSTDTMDQDFTGNQEATDGQRKDVNKAKLGPSRQVILERDLTLSRCGRFSLLRLNNSLNRFRIIGPKTGYVLKSVCQPADVNPAISDQGSTLPAKEASSDQECSDLFWWKQFYGQSHQGINAGDENVSVDGGQTKVSYPRRQQEAERADLLRKLGKIETFSNLANFAATVRDPRVLLPIKRQMVKAAFKRRSIRSIEVSTTCYNDAPIFNQAVRKAVTDSKWADAKINDLRHKVNPVPGRPLSLGVEESRVPLLFLPQSTGIDLIVPAGWGMSFWMSLVFQGCRVGGERELRHHQLEQGDLSLPLRHIDSLAGHHELETAADDLKEKYFRRPPKKRSNYNKIAVAAPFMPAFDLLVKEWQAGNDDTDCADRKPSVLRDLTVLEAVEAGSNNLSVEPGHDHAVVTVKLKILGNGTLSPNTMICIPSDEDLTALAELNPKDITAWNPPREELAKDRQQSVRSKLLKDHQVNKKKLKRRWQKIRSRQTQAKCQSTALGKPLDEERMNSLAETLMNLKNMREQEIETFKVEHDNLWVQEPSQIRHSASREIFGFLLAGEFSYRVGSNVGLGYAAFNGIMHWQRKMNSFIESRSDLEPSLRNQIKTMVLVREITCLQYRIAELSFVKHA